MTEDATRDTVERSRIARLVDVLSLAAIGEFEHERCSIKVEHEDDFAMLEQTLSLFIQELAAAHRENELHVRELTESRHELENQLLTIRSQQAAIKRLSTPMLEVWDGVLVLPVIGVIDAERASDMTENLLGRVVETGSRSVIIDVTGAAGFDTATADHFLRLLKAARLLGAQCVLTGISAENARALIALDVYFEDVVTLRSLKEGLKRFMERPRQKRPTNPREPNPRVPPDNL
jgi:rsbT co-antagonist protein RsbR